MAGLNLNLHMVTSEKDIDETMFSEKGRTLKKNYTGWLDKSEKESEMDQESPMMSTKFNSKLVKEPIKIVKIPSKKITEV